jgi:hypothetical protein
MENDKKTNGATLGLVVIIIILVIGGIYIWHSKIKQLELQRKQENVTSVS